MSNWLSNKLNAFSRGFHELMGFRSVSVVDLNNALINIRYYDERQDGLLDKPLHEQAGERLALVQSRTMGYKGTDSKMRKSDTIAAMGAHAFGIITKDGSPHTYETFHDALSTMAERVRVFDPRFHAPDGSVLICGHILNEVLCGLHQVEYAATAFEKGNQERVAMEAAASGLGQIIGMSLTRKSATISETKLLPPSHTGKRQSAVGAKTSL